MTPEDQSPHWVQQLRRLRALAEREGWGHWPDVGDGVFLQRLMDYFEGRETAVLPKRLTEREQPIGDPFVDGHGFTCGTCSWGRDRPRAMDEWQAHMQAEHGWPKDKSYNQTVLTERPERG